MNYRFKSPFDLYEYMTLMNLISLHLVRFSYLSVLRMRASILHPFSHAELLYLMYLHYCKGRFMVGVGVDVNKTQSNR